MTANCEWRRNGNNTIYGLLNYTVSSWDHIASNDKVINKMVNWKGCGRTWSRPKCKALLWHLPEGLRKTMKNLSQHSSLWADIWNQDLLNMKHPTRKCFITFLAPQEIAIIISSRGISLSFCYSNIYNMQRPTSDTLIIFPPDKLNSYEMQYTVTWNECVKLSCVHVCTWLPEHWNRWGLSKTQQGYGRSLKCHFSLRANLTVLQCRSHTSLRLCMFVQQDTSWSVL
jgi:hypothetical protein